MLIIKLCVILHLRLNFNLNNFLMSIYTTIVLNPFIAILSNHLDAYPTPINLSYL